MQTAAGSASLLRVASPTNSPRSPGQAFMEKVGQDFSVRSSVSSGVDEEPSTSEEEDSASDGRPLGRLRALAKSTGMSACCRQSCRESSAGFSSARSHDSGRERGGRTMRTDAAFPCSIWLHSRAALKPGLSLSGQITMWRPRRGLASAFRTALEPPLQVMGAYSGKRANAASEVFSPSTRRTEGLS